MDGVIALGEEQFTKLGVQGAKGDGFEFGAVAGNQGAAHMVGSGLVGVDHFMGGDTNMGDGWAEP